MNEDPLVLPYIAVLVGLLAAAFVSAFIKTKKHNKLRKTMLEHQPISATYFLDNWQIGKRRTHAGYKFLDQPGCFAILVNPSDGENGPKAEKIFIGNSSKVCTQIKTHLSSDGSDGFARSIKNGKDVKVRIYPCLDTELKDTEHQIKEYYGLNEASSSRSRKRGKKRRR